MIHAQLLDLRSKVETLRTKIKPFKESGNKPLTEAELNKAEALLKKWGLEWKRRKRGCMDALNAIAESMDINPKEFAKKVQIETDEDLKVVCPV